MIDCTNGDVRDALPDYLNDRLDASRRREVESHLAKCDSCREELSLLRALHVSMQRAPRVDVGAIAAAIPPYRAPVRRGWATPWRVAAAIVAISVGGTSIALLRDRKPLTHEDVTPYLTAQPTPHRDSSPSVVASPAAVAHEMPAPVRPSPEIERVTPVSSHELAMVGGSIGDLSDGELATLVDDLESLDGLPSTEVEGAEPVSLGSKEGI